MSLHTDCIVSTTPMTENDMALLMFVCCCFFIVCFLPCWSFWATRDAYIQCQQ